MEQAQFNQVKTISYSLGRIMMMGVFSIVLCVSFLLSIFTPYPIGLASVLFGRAKGIVLALVVTFVFYFINLKSNSDFALFFFYVFSVVIALVMAEIIHRKLKPIKSIAIVGGVTCLIALASFSTVVLEDQKTVKQVIVEHLERNEKAFNDIRLQLKAQNDPKSFENQALLANPAAMADMLINRAPGLLIMSLFLMLWINMFLLLKSHRLVSKDVLYSEKDMINFSLPEAFVVGVVISLMLQIFGEKFAWWLPVLGSAMLSFFGVFYLFIGFGIYSDFLDHYKIKGFFRTFLIVITFLTAPLLIVVALVGLFDTFINFRKFLKTNNSDTK